MSRSRTILIEIVALLMAVPLALTAQRGGGGLGRWLGGVRSYDNVRYDGRFTFVRIAYQGYSRWSADWPVMEQNLTTMLKELTAVPARNPETNVLTLDDPELMKFPVAYLTEPGSWYPNNAEVLGLRNYLAKGGFLIVDDFHYANEWRVFEDAMMRVAPDARIDTLELSHPIFNSFFAIQSLKVPYPGRLGELGLMGEFYGIHENNDPSERLMVVINYNMDIGDYMEWSGEKGWYAQTPTNEAYKFGINYVVYGLTH